MNECSIDQLELYSDQLAAAVKSLRQSAGNKDAIKAKSSIGASLERIKALIDGPELFLQRLATQVEILSSLKWLLEFQILACIPPSQSISLPIKDLADLAGVPTNHLRRVIRLVATSGFLQETKPDHVSHTAISAQFLTEQSLCDAVDFLASSSTPAALRMADATRLQSTGQELGLGLGLGPGTSNSKDARTAYGIAFDSAVPFRELCGQQARLHRQWCAYLRHAAGLHYENEIVEMICGLSWSNLGSSCIVEIGAKSTSISNRLAKTFPNLELITQLNNPISESDTVNTNTNNSRVTVTYRKPGTPQPITTAAAYILHLPRAPTLELELEHELELVRAELDHLLGSLRASGGIALVLTHRLLPEPGSLPDSRLEAVARARDIGMLQLSNEGEMEMSDLLGIIESVGDGVGRLVVTNKLVSCDGVVLAVVLKHLFIAC